jgi:hypothetical protein
MKLAHIILGALLTTAAHAKTHEQRVKDIVDYTQTDGKVYRGLQLDLGRDVDLPKTTEEKRIEVSTFSLDNYGQNTTDCFRIGDSPYHLYLDCTTEQLPSIPSPPRAQLDGKVDAIWGVSKILPEPRFQVEFELEIDNRYGSSTNIYIQTEDIRSRDQRGYRKIVREVHKRLDL